MSQLHDLAKPFPSKFVHVNPSGGGSYVKHHVVNQRLLQVVGPFNFELVQVVRGFVAGRPPNPAGNSPRAKAGTPDLSDAVVGAVCRLACDVDGQPVWVEEVGDCEEPNNWPHDGARLKDAMSDALKRCAMRLGCGLHLWSQDEYFLFTRLDESATAETPAGPTATRPASPARKEDAKQTPTEGRTAGGAPSDLSPPADPMTDLTRRRLFAKLNDHGIKERTQRLHWAGVALGRPCPSFDTVGEADAQTLMLAADRVPAS